MNNDNLMSVSHISCPVWDNVINNTNYRQQSLAPIITRTPSPGLTIASSSPTSPPKALIIITRALGKNDAIGLKWWETHKTSSSFQSLSY